MNYIDKIIKDNLSDIQIVPRKTWKDIHQKISSDNALKMDEYPNKVASNSILNIGFRAFVLLSVIVGSIFLTGRFNKNKGVSPMAILKDTTIKSKKSILNDSLLKLRIETHDLKSNDVEIRVIVPIHKNVTLKKKIILTDTTNN